MQPNLSRASWIRVVAILLLAAWGAGSALGGPFEIRFGREQTAESGELLYGMLRHGQRQFRFVPPADYRLDVRADEKRIVLTTADSLVRLEVVFLSRALARPTGEDAGKEEVLGMFPGAKILEQFPSFVGGKASRGYDLEWAGAHGHLLRAKVVVCPDGQGALVFSYSASVAAGQRGMHSFSTLMTSFTELGPIMSKAGSR